MNKRAWRPIILQKDGERKEFPNMKEASQYMYYGPTYIADYLQRHGRNNFTTPSGWEVKLKEVE